MATNQALSYSVPANNQQQPMSSAAAPQHNSSTNSLNNQQQLPIQPALNSTAILPATNLPQGQQQHQIPNATQFYDQNISSQSVWPSMPPIAHASANPAAMSDSINSTKMEDINTSLDKILAQFNSSLTHSAPKKLSVWAIPLMTPAQVGAPYI